MQKQSGHKTKRGRNVFLMHTQICIYNRNPQVYVCRRISLIFSKTIHVPYVVTFIYKHLQTACRFMSVCNFLRLKCFVLDGEMF